ncbi:hypothetical protein FHS18_005205 [Paenibacillus phyllosphaerae]|uniref:Uncharacterized protein n=1 Tax=Paenibacillus phyllosphaerae TaxID=274593 RepID=A0A7W5B2N1_9BACL|nr:hypothetical protein [Paenibacillus phyllosphaerae]MBB3113102.1 hypothetical protein [Paenibacillus phyllosphaerae]
MKFLIIWNAFFKVKNEEKAVRLINQIEKRIGHLTVSKQFERSKREPSLLGATFVSKLNDDMTMEAAVFQTLQIINTLGTAWTVYSPLITNDLENPSEVLLSFEGFHNNPRFTGLSWVQFHLETETGWEHTSAYGTNFVNQLE